MIFTRSLLLVLLTGVLTSSAVCQKASPGDRVAGWATDIDFLLDQISKQHYVYKSKPLPGTLIGWSGAMGSISNRYHESMPGDTRSWIEPEIKVPLSSRDYFSNRDPVLDEVLRRYGSVN